MHIELKICLNKFLFCGFETLNPTCFELTFVLFVFFVRFDKILKKEIPSTPVYEDDLVNHEVFLSFFFFFPYFNFLSSYCFSLLIMLLLFYSAFCFFIDLSFFKQAKISNKFHGSQLEQVRIVNVIRNRHGVDRFLHGFSLSSIHLFFQIPTSNSRL